MIPWPPERIAAGRAQFERLAADAGLPVGERRHWYDSQPAHEAVLWAREQGAEDAFHHAIYAAYFVEDRNIGSPDVLADLAGKLGLPADELRQALADGRYRAAVQADFEESRMAGVTAVPTFVAGGYALVGAHPIENLRKLLRHVGAVPRDGQTADRFSSPSNLLGPQIEQRE